VTEEESEEEPGTVLEQSPAAAKKVNKNSAVDLTVAKGVKVPDVVDETEEDATGILEDAGF
jgi:eukaryotic-like serine/threonine-protein kinase